MEDQTFSAYMRRRAADCQRLAAGFSAHAREVLERKNLSEVELEEALRVQSLSARCYKLARNIMGIED